MASMTRNGLAVFALGWALLALAACSLPEPRPPRSLEAASAQLKADVFLSARGPARADARFDFPVQTGATTRLTLVSTAPRPMPAELSCDGAARLEAAGQNLYLRPAATRRFSLPVKHHAPPPVLILSSGSTRCSLRWGEGRQMALVREDLGDPEVARLDRRVASCHRPDPAGLDPLERVFWADRPLSQGCAAPTGAVTLLPGELEALKYRMDKLTGSDIAPAALAARDPAMALDFSHAPHFDQVVISYLLIRSDYAGYLVARALAFHAARGTKVRIIASATLMEDFDRRLFETLASDYPNVQIQYYTWPAQSPGQALDTVQRSNHVKLFLGLSSNPGRSFAIVGGRNLTEGFFLPGKGDYPDQPFLHSYAREAGTLQGVVFHSVYDDFEVALTDDARVADLAAQFGKYWNRDRAHELMVPAASASAVGGAPRGGVVRHFISLPWADGQDHEAYYADLMDAARHDIDIVSPMTYPPPALQAALERAAARGVRVRLVCRRNADEPPSDFTGALNAEFMTRGWDRFEIRSFLPPGEKVGLHTKLIVIDGRLAVVASSNLNQRSYYHDTENGLVFLDTGVADRLQAVFEGYWAGAQSRPYEGDYRLLQGLFDAFPALRQYF